MNKIDSSFSSEGQPFQSPLHLDFLQNANKEAVTNAILGIIGDSYSTTTWYRLYGAELTNTGGDSYTNTVGAVFYNGEVYTVDAVGGAGTLMDSGIKLEVVETATGTTTMASGATRDLNLVRKARFANDTVGLDTLWRPTEVRVSGVYVGNATGTTVTVTTECVSYYSRTATGSGTFTATIDDTARVIGGRAIVSVTVSGTFDIAFTPPSGSTVVSRGPVTGLTTSFQLNIDYAGNDLYFVTIVAN